MSNSPAASQHRTIIHPHARHVIVVGIDGLRPDMINAATMPNLTAMRARGVSSKDHRTVFPSETRGALTALASGARPETTGVLGNEFYSRDGSGLLTGTDTIHDWRAGDKRLIGGMVTATNLSETLAKNGKSFAVVTSSGQGSFTALNWKGGDWGQTGYNVRHPAVGFPPELAVDIAEQHRVPANGLDRGAEKQAVAVFTDTVWPAKKPDAAIIWLTEVDSASHRYGLGAEGMLASMRDCDIAIGNLLEWRDRQPEKDGIVIFVTSDHGHSTIVEFISVGDAFKEAGISADTRLGDGVDVLYRRGRAPGFWLKKFDKGLLQGVFDALAVQPWYGATFTPAIERGSHEGILPGTLALELTGAAHPRAPDLYINLKGDGTNNAFGVPGTSVCDAGSYSGIPLGGGSHGGLHSTELAVVLIGEGAGLKSGGQVIASRTAIYDIAPTVLEMLGLKPASSMTGRPMFELFEEGEAVEAPVVTEFTAAIDGKVSRIVIGHVAGRAYIDEADLLTENADAYDAQPKVAELQA
ncbi:alkaline phosphatase family protein [Neorhizobium galegae]|uniref:alkaline phosphatase family protein n=1 Tax=Neorhizobium galegae TaxID=399 RepID=UPI002105AA69|nr:alkaline phosphatase family protein [Neorhizobium galegae]MCQ1853664.1 alkaline phosphatase family protein [Neorhizobium galegae]